MKCLPAAARRRATSKGRSLWRAAHGSLPLMNVERRRSHVDLTEAPLVKDGVTQYQGNTLLLSNMVLRLEGRRAENPPETGAGFHGLSPLQIPTDAGYFYFQAVSWGSVLNLPPRVRRLGGTVSFRGGFCR